MRHALIVVGTCLFMCACIGGGSSTSKAAPVEAPHYFAYATEQKLIVMKDASVVASQPYKIVPKYGRPAWTLDHRHIAVVEDDEGHPDSSDLRRLMVIDTTTGHTRTIPCPRCLTLAAIGQSTVMVDQETEHALDESFATVLRFDLNSDDPPAQVTTKLPVLNDARFIADGRDSALMTGTADDFQQYYLLQSNGRAQFAATVREQRPQDKSGKPYGRGIGAATTVLASDGNAFAVATIYQRRSECGGFIQLELVHPIANWHEINTSQFDPPSSKSRESTLYVTDVWWGYDHYLHAIFAAGFCDAATFTTPPSEWRLIGKHWQRASGDYVYQKAELSPTCRVVLRAKSLADQPTLYFVNGDHETRIAAGGIQIVAPSSIV